MAPGGGFTTYSSCWPPWAIPPIRPMAPTASATRLIPLTVSTSRRWSATSTGRHSSSPTIRSTHHTPTTQMGTPTTMAAKMTVNTTAPTPAAVAQRAAISSKLGGAAASGGAGAGC